MREGAACPVVPRDAVVMSRICCRGVEDSGCSRAHVDGKIDTFFARRWLEASQQTGATQVTPSVARVCAKNSLEHDPRPR